MKMTLLDTIDEPKTIGVSNSMRRSKRIGLATGDIQRLAACQTVIQKMVTLALGTHTEKEIVKLAPILAWEEKIHVKVQLESIEDNCPRFYNTYIATCKDEEKKRKIAIFLSDTHQYTPITNMLMDMSIFNNDLIGILEVLNKLKKMHTLGVSDFGIRIIKMAKYQSQDQIIKIIERLHKISNKYKHTSTILMPNFLSIIESKGPGLVPEEVLSHLESMDHIQSQVDTEHVTTYIYILEKLLKIIKGDIKTLATLNRIIEDTIAVAGSENMYQLINEEVTTLEAIEEKAEKIMIKAIEKGTKKGEVAHA